MRCAAIFRRRSRRDGATGKANAPSSRRCTRTGDGCGARTARAYSDGAGELIERSFAHCYETGGMRRCHLRGRENILKRQLIHVGAFNLSLILRKLLGAGTPRELKNRAGQVFSRLLRFLLCLMTTVSPARRLTAAVGQPLVSSFRCRMPRHRSRNISSSATGC